MSVRVRLPVVPRHRLTWLGYSPGWVTLRGVTQPKTPSVPLFWNNRDLCGASRDLVLLGKAAIHASAALITESDALMEQSAELIDGACSAREID
jgi:hypothetical protein